MTAPQTTANLPLRFLLPLAIAIVGTVLLLESCSGSLPRRDPTGEAFPAVVGASLEEERVELPDAFAGEPAILLIGYEQAAQFDIDRWVMGFLQSEVDAPLVEVPTIPGLVPSFASSWIDEGMRGGIPEEDWSAVVTLYGSAAEPVAKATGTANGQVARIIVLDAEGRIAWFDDTGYAARKALEVADRIERLRSGRD